MFIWWIICDIILRIIEFTDDRNKWIFKLILFLKWEYEGMRLWRRLLCWPAPMRRPFAPGRDDFLHWMGGPIVFVNIEMKNYRYPLLWSAAGAGIFPGRIKDLMKKSRGFWKYIRTQFIWESAAAATGKVRLFVKRWRWSLLFLRKRGYLSCGVRILFFKKIPYFPAVGTRSGRQENGI